MAEQEQENELDEGTIKKYANEAGSVAFAALQRARELVKPGAKLIDVADALEAVIREKGMEPAFPVNLSINAQAAHYAPGMDDALAFSDRDVVKVDLGAAKEGVLSDCAATIDLSGKMQGLVEATQEALADAIGAVRAGVRVSDIGKAIEAAITKRGFKPIRNLGGHGLGIHDLHSEPFIPNYANGDDTVLGEGDLIAIEPFATTAWGRGYVASSDVHEIFSFMGEAQVRMADARVIMAEISKRYPSEPFAARWLAKSSASRFSLYSSLSALVGAGALEAHPMLIETAGGMVSQAEASVIVTKDSCEVTTK